MATKVDLQMDGTSNGAGRLQATSAGIVYLFT